MIWDRSQREAKEGGAEGNWNAIKHVYACDSQRTINLKTHIRKMYKSIHTFLFSPANMRDSR